MNLYNRSNVDQYAFREKRDEETGVLLGCKIDEEPLLRYNYLLSGIIVHDIDEDGGAMLVCRGSHKQLGSIYDCRGGRAGGMGLAALRECEELAEQRRAPPKLAALPSVPAI